MHFYQGTVLKCPPGSFVSIGGFMVSDYIELARNIS